MKAITFLIRLVEPVLATQAQSGEANSAITYPFIPGSMLRGALIARFQNGQPIDAGKKKIQNLFFNGTVRYLNAYLAHPANDSRSLPRPLSWFVPKDEADRPEVDISDFAIEVEQWTTPPKSPGLGEFCWASDEAVQLGTPILQATVHNLSTDRNRKYETASQVFRYDSIAAGEVFAGVIVADDDDLLLKEIKPLLEQRGLNLGGSRTTGYGQAEIFDIQEQDDWREFIPDSFSGPSDGVIDEFLDFLDDEEVSDVASPAEGEFAGSSSDQVVLTCLSDLILLGSERRFCKKWQELIGAEPNKTFQRLRLVGGFNRKWGLPLPQAWAIQAGSVFVFPAAYKDKLEERVEKGMGERRTEGFGRIAVNWHIRPKLSQRQLPLPEIKVSVPAELSTESKKLAQRMAGRQLQARLDYALVEKINSLSSDLRGLPSPAQLSRARLAARRAWLNNDLTEITRHFENLSNLTQREWEDARIKGHKLKTWILDQIEKGDVLSLGPIKPAVAKEEAAFSPRLINQTKARLIEGVLQRAVKKAKNKVEGGQNER